MECNEFLSSNDLNSINDDISFNFLVEIDRISKLRCDIGRSYEQARSKTVENTSSKVVLRLLHKDWSH